MLDIAEEKLDQIKLKGYRPVVVGCFVNKRKILMVYKAEYKLWQLPQGGIEVAENLSQALRREMQEELSLTIAEKSLVYLGTTVSEFPEKFQGSRELKTKSGRDIKMIGKKYFFIAAKADFTEFDLKKTEFDDYRWLNYLQARDLIDKIYQPGKKRITLKALKLLHQSKLIA